MSAQDSPAPAPAPDEAAIRAQVIEECARAADRYMLAVRRLGERSGYNGMIFFEVPLLSSPEAVGTDAILRWKELNNAGKALTEAVAQLRALAHQPAAPAPASDGEAG